MAAFSWRAKACYKNVAANTMAVRGLGFVVGAAAVGVAGAAELALTWTDCGDSSTHAKITGLTPSSITTGKKARISGTGIVDTDVTGATYDLEMKTMVGTVSCKGDASQSKSCSLPLGLGMLTFDAMTFPIKKGSTSVNVDLSLSALIPGGFARTETKVQATGTDGSNLFCMDIKSKPAAEEFMLPVIPAVSEVEPRARLALTWTDCGDSSTHAKITGLTPSSITTGKKARISGTGIVDTDVTGATYDLEMKTMVGTVSCKGDASQSKSCSLPLGLGMLTFDAMTFPIKKGSTSVNVDLSLSALIPGGFARTETKVQATGTDGSNLFCMDIKSKPAADETVDRSNVIVV